MGVSLGLRIAFRHADHAGETLDSGTALRVVAVREVGQGKQQQQR